MSKLTMRLCTAGTVLAAVVLTIATVSRAAGSEDSEKFLSKSYQDGLAEIRSCNLALQRAASPEIKTFAQRMIKDHSAIDSKIQAIAREKKITLPGRPSLKQTATYDMLALKSGPGFDETFIEHNVSDHQSDVEDFTNEVRHASDPTIKTFASYTLSTLKEHLRLSRSLRDHVKRNRS